MSKSQVRRLSEHLPDIAKELKTVTVVVGNTDRFETLVYVTPAFAQSLADQVSAATTRLAALEADARRKEEALRELVSLKDLKDSLIADYVVNGHPVYSGVNELQYAEYELRKPLAWAAARAALSQEPGGK